MIHYLKAELYKIYAEKRFATSLTLLFVVSFLMALLYKNDTDPEYTLNIIQLLSAILPLFIVSPVSAFFGDDFVQRTINNIITKDKQRQKLISYKILTSLLFVLLYILLAYTSTMVFRTLFSGQVDYNLVFKLIPQQLPLYATITLFACFLFVLFNKNIQSYTTYVLSCLLLDNIASLVFNNMLKINIPEDYFLFATLQNQTEIPQTTLTFSLALCLIFWLSCYQLFIKKELK